MRAIKFTITSILIMITFSMTAQINGFPLSLEIKFDESVKKDIHSDGRLYIFLNSNSQGEPRQYTWPSSGNFIFAKNFSGIDVDNGIVVANTNGWSTTAKFSLTDVPEGDYFLQVLWDWDTSESRINAPGNQYSTKKKITVDTSKSIQVNISNTIQNPNMEDHELLEVVEYKSDTLSKWWGKEILVKAAILLPKDFHENTSKKYPVRYNVAGYGGRYTRANSLVRNKAFMKWWQSDDAPEVINVFLDGEGPFGDSYQMDSDNSGPYGYNLIHELIPFIEKKYRGYNSGDMRFVDGCSTGGWVSLGLQLYYPDAFNGCFSYSPDAIEFENYQLINIYKDNNAYINEFGYDRPVMRSVKGEPMMKLKDFINYENVQGSSDSYLNSGGQFSAHTALYSPKGRNGLPQPLFNPKTGVIDQTVAEHWKKYDFKLYLKENWTEIGPKLQGKIYIWMGDMDHFYLNMATRAFSEYLETTTAPKSDAVIEFSAMEGHCSQYGHKKVLQQIKKRLEN
jgi:enterochelin esterase-like enzyme